jgi:hypothetical protein
LASKLQVGALTIIILLACLHLAQLPMNTVTWVPNHLMRSGASLVSLSSEPLPNLAPCLRNQDANLFARAGNESPAAVVIPIYQTTHCSAFWWVVRYPIQTLNFYMLHHVPGRATAPELQNKILTQQQHMFHAWAGAAKGVLDVSDVVGMAETVNDRGPVFVMAPRDLSVQANAALSLVDTSDAFALWRVVVPGKKWR